MSLPPHPKALWKSVWKWILRWLHNFFLISTEKEKQFYLTSEPSEINWHTNMLSCYGNLQKIQLKIFLLTWMDPCTRVLVLLITTRQLADIAQKIMNFDSRTRKAVCPVCPWPCKRILSASRCLICLLVMCV